jgi:hypothetical protein
MMQFNRLEAAPVGPLSTYDNENFKSLALASQIYAYPYSNTCGVDRQLTRGKIENIPQLPFNVKGLTALEYLLFEPTLNSSCKQPYPDVVAWEKRPAAQKQEDRCRWAQAYAKDLVRRADTLEEYWNLNKGNFTKSLIDNKKPYAPLRKGTNALTNSLFSLERLRDLRLGNPLGMYTGCPEGKDFCPEMVEHPYSGLALQAQAETLKFFVKVFSGNFTEQSEGFGLDDLLNANKNTEASQKILDRLEELLARNAALQEKGPLMDQIRNLNREACLASTSDDRREELCAYQKDVADLMQLFKIEVLTTLSLDAPPGLEGDND